MLHVIPKVIPLSHTALTAHIFLNKETPWISTFCFTPQLKIQT